LSKEPASFKQALRHKDFVVTAELPLTAASSRASLLRDAALLGDCVDGFVLTDNQYGQPHMAPGYAAGILLRHDFPPVLQISSRNRNRIALIGEILGARAAGVDTLLLVRGAVLPEGYEPRPAAVLDTDAKDLIATAKLLNDDAKLGPGEEILIGTSATVHDPAAPDKVPEELLAKADAGARLAVTQICLNADVLRRYMKFLVGHKVLQRLSVIVSVALITSHELALWLRDNRHGTIFAADTIERLAAARDAEAAAIEYTAALVSEIAGIPGVVGVNFAAAGDLPLIPRVLAAAGVRG